MSDEDDGGRLRLTGLSRGEPRGFDLRPGASALAALRDRLGLIGLRKVRLAGEVFPEGSRNWRLEARLGATVTQPCVVTLAPVTTRLEQPVARRYLADWAEPEGAEVEMEPDDGLEPLPETIDLGAILEEELSLALPLYPRAEGVDFTEPDPTPEDERQSPFAGLAGLRERLDGDPE